MFWVNAIKEELIGCLDALHLNFQSNIWHFCFDLRDNKRLLCSCLSSLISHLQDSFKNNDDFSFEQGVTLLHYHYIIYSNIYLVDRISICGHNFAALDFVIGFLFSAE